MIISHRYIFSMPRIYLLTKLNYSWILQTLCVNYMPEAVLEAGDSGRQKTVQFSAPSVVGDT